MLNKDILLAVFDDEIVESQSAMQKAQEHDIKSTLSFSGGGGGGGGGGGACL